MKKKMSILLPAGALLLCAGLSNINNAKLLLASETHTVARGETIVIEDRTLVHGDEKKVVQGKIYFPDGTLKEGKSFTANDPGLYRVSYKTYFGVEEVEETIDYIRNRNAMDLFTLEDGGSMEIADFSYNTPTKSVSGLAYDMTSRSILKYNKVIDFNSFTKNDTLFQFLVDTSIQGDADIDQFIVRLTDTEDENNRVDIIIKDCGPENDDGRGCYIAIGSKNQYKTGREYFNGEWKIHYDTFGSNVHSSFRALPVSDPVSPAKIFFDYGEKAFYCDAQFGNNATFLMTDLDDPNIYGSSIWEGFSKGTATLSVIANGLNSNTGRVIFPQMLGMDFSSGDFVDKTSPKINIDYEGQSIMDLPKAIVGSPYKIYGASITDDFDEGLGYSVNVTYKDTSKGKNKDVSVVNGEFTPTKAGEYVIAYKAKDIFGNEANKRITVAAVDSIGTLNVALPETSTTAEIYSEVSIPSTKELSISGANGIPSVSRTLYDKDDNELEITGDSFVPEEVGEYKVVYNVSDYTGASAQATYTINVPDLDKPKFIDPANMPEVLIKGHTYDINRRLGVETENGVKKIIDSTAKINGNSASEFKFVAGEVCELTYVLDGSTGVTEEKINIPVIDGKEGKDQAAYFYGDFDSIVENEEDVTLSSSHDSKARFANILPYDYLNVAFERGDASLYERIEFKFTDSTDPHVSLTFKIRFNDETPILSIGSEGNSYEMYKDSNRYAVTFNSSTLAVTDVDSSHQLTSVRKDDNGNIFSGFKNGVYLDIKLVGVTGLSSLRIKSISNQDFGHKGLYEDITNPIILLREPFKNTQERGTKAHIPNVQAFDVLGQCAVTMNIRHPNGKFIYQNEPFKQGMTFDLDSFGDYNVNYVAVDNNNGNRTALMRKIVVYDDIPPELNVNWNLSSTYSVGDGVKIPEYTVSDNTGKYTVDVFLTLPNYEMRLLQKDVSGEKKSYLAASNFIYNSSFKINSTTFRLELRGTYKLKVVAYDDDFNKVSDERTFVAR